MSKLSNIWTKIKEFFNESTTILYARIQALVGFIFAVAGTVDWSAIQTWDFTTPRQTAWLGIGLVVNGVITEILRRRSLSA